MSSDGFRLGYPDVVAAITDNAVRSVSHGAGITVDSTDPAHPIVTADSSLPIPATVHTTGTDPVVTIGANDLVTYVTNDDDVNTLTLTGFNVGNEGGVSLFIDGVGFGGSDIKILPSGTMSSAQYVLNQIIGDMGTGSTTPSEPSTPVAITPDDGTEFQVWFELAGSPAGFHRVLTYGGRGVVGAHTRIVSAGGLYKITTGIFNIKISGSIKAGGVFTLRRYRIV